MAVRVDFESAGVFCPDASDVLVGRETAKGLQTAAVIVGIDEELEVLPEFVVAGVVVALDGGILDGAVHPLDLAIGPRVVRFGEPVLNAVLATDLIEAVDAIASVGPSRLRGRSANWMPLSVKMVCRS